MKKQAPMQRVSAGVYRNTSGQLVNPKNGIAPVGPRPPQGKPMPQAPQMSQPMQGQAPGQQLPGQFQAPQNTWNQIPQMQAPQQGQWNQQQFDPNFNPMAPQTLGGWANNQGMGNQFGYAQNLFQNQGQMPPFNFQQAAMNDGRFLQPGPLMRGFGSPEEAAQQRMRAAQAVGRGQGASLLAEPPK